MSRPRPGIAALFFLLLACACVPRLLSAQLVFIPDLLMRDWLEQRVPGVMDGAGYMDTSHPGIASVTNATINCGAPFGPSDLTGLEHLLGLQYLEVMCLFPPVQIPALPPGLQSLFLLGYPSSTLPALPAGLTYLSLGQATGLTALPVLPASLESMYLNGLPVLSSIPALPPGLEDLHIQSAPQLATVPALPGGLVRLTLRDCGVGSVPPLNAGLEEVVLWDLPALAQLPSWPSSVERITIIDLPLVQLAPPLPSGCQRYSHSGTPLVSALPALPQGLIGFGLADLPLLPAWPALPAGLQGLSVGSMPFNDLPPLPAGLSSLSVGSLAGLDWLPPLPQGIEYLSLEDLPGLQGLPELPADLQELRLLDLPLITSLPPLPGQLEDLWLEDCDGVSCLPVLPASLFSLLIVSPVINCLPAPLPPWLFPDVSFDPNTLCADPCQMDTAMLGGRVFHDQNANGIQDPGEAPLAGAQVHLVGHARQVSTDASGRYRMAVLPGPYEVVAASASPYPQSTLPAIHQALLPVNGSADTTLDFGIWLEPGHPDLAVEIAASPAKPGFTNSIWLSVHVPGTEAVGGTLTFTWDADQNWVSADLAPDVVSGQAATWSVPPLPPGSMWTVQVVLGTPVPTPLGTPIEHLAQLSTTVSDEDPANNTATWIAEVVGSFDPNDKLVDQEEVDWGDYANGARSAYTVRFQNTGTAAATFVDIVDTLSADLQPASLRFLASSHACTWELRGRVLRFRFDDIALPDSASDPLGSQGYVRFSVLPVTGLPPGTTISNEAAIFFDYNEPIVTPPALFNLFLSTDLNDRSAGEGRVWPLPAGDQLWVDLPGIRTTAPYRIRSLAGMVMKEGHWSGPDLPIGISRLPAGAYLLEFVQDQRPVMIRFIKE